MSSFEGVRNILVDQLQISARDIQMESLIIDDLGADSLDVVETIMAVEEKFTIEIPDEIAEKMKTVKDVVSYIDHIKHATPKPSFIERVAKAGVGYVQNLNQEALDKKESFRRCPDSELVRKIYNSGNSITTIVAAKAELFDRGYSEDDIKEMHRQYS